ncbi:MAG: hypothetical protein ACKVT0_21785 [Planctomycetaceae bacterium]
MASKDLMNLWNMITNDLQRARATLPAGAVEDRVIKAYEEYLEHNELEVACDMLEVYAEDHDVTPEFWLSLRDASLKMELRERAARYASEASEG